MKTTVQDITQSSALQLYHTAYRCHYEASDLKDACRLYREIIKQFPDSNEAAYAVIQLEKIGAEEALKNLHDSPWQKLLPLAAMLFSLLALFLAATAVLLVLDKNDTSRVDQKPPLYCSTCRFDYPPADNINGRYNEIPGRG